MEAAQPRQYPRVALGLSTHPSESRLPHILEVPPPLEIGEWDQDVTEIARVERDTLSEATVTLRTVVTFVTWNRVSSLESVL